jgi:predicted small lipoprotein YifL
MIRRTAALLLSIALLPACGTKGALYLPTAEQLKAKEEQAAQKREKQQKAAEKQQNNNEQSPPQ